MECGKADAYLGSWHSGEHSNTSLHPTNHRNGRRTASVQAEKGKGSQKPTDPIQKHILPGEGTSVMTAQPTRSNRSIVLDLPGRQFCLFAETKSLQFTHAPNQKRFAAPTPDLAFLVALEQPRLLVEVSPASLFCFLYWKLR